MPSSLPWSSSLKPKSGLTFYVRPVAATFLYFSSVAASLIDPSFATRNILAPSDFSCVLFSTRPLAHPSRFWMQSEKDAERIRFLGAPADRVRASGNLKYDLDLPAPTAVSNWLASEVARSGRTPVIVAGSVVATEEPLALIAFGTLQGEHPNALLVLAPRKPERFDDAADFIHESRRKFLPRSPLAI